MRNDIGKYFTFSLFLHLSVLSFLLVRQSKPAYIYLPIQLQFYSRSNGQAVSVPEQVKEQSAPVKKTPEKKHEGIRLTKKKEILKETPKPSPKESFQGKVTAREEAAPPGAAAQAVSGSNISFDAVNFPYAYYTNMVVKRIGQHWSWGNKFGRLKSLIYFRIGRDGTVKDVAVKRTSGEDVFDQQAMRSVELSSPFPPLPEGYKEESLGVYFEFSYTD